MKNVLVIGVGEFGSMLCEDLNRMGHQIMAVDRSEEKINAVLPYVTEAQIGDSTDPRFLESLGIPDYDVCFVTISQDFQGSLETTYQLKELGAKKVVSRSDRRVQKKILLRNGADEVIHPKEEMAQWAATRYTSNGVFDYMKLDENNAIFEVAVPDEWIGRTVEELDVRRRYGINILAFRDEKGTDMLIQTDTPLPADRNIIVLGATGALKKCFKI